MSFWNSLYLVDGRRVRRSTSIVQIEHTYFHIDTEIMISNARAGYFVSDDCVIVAT